MSRFDRLSIRYTAECLAAAGLFVLVSYAVHPYLDANRPLTGLVALALVATLPMVLVVWSVYRFFRDVDERERYILATAGAITLLAGVIAAVFLAKLGAVLTVNLNFFAAFLLIFWTLATLVVRWKS
ncbi:hypothetical protein [Roseibium sp. LAB1]